MILPLPEVERRATTMVPQLSNDQAKERGAPKRCERCMTDIAAGTESLFRQQKHTPKKCKLRQRGGAFSVPLPRYHIESTCYGSKKKKKIHSTHVGKISRTHKRTTRQPKHMQTHTTAPQFQHYRTCTYPERIGSQSVQTISRRNPPNASAINTSKLERVTSKYTKNTIRL